MNLPLRQNEPLALSTMHEDDFEELCRALLEKQPDIRSAELYGRRGQRQHGIDIFARRKDGIGLEVGQCKCYKELDEAGLKDAVKPFIASWSHWKGHGVSRFILFVACSTRDTKLQEEILAQDKVFRDRGVTLDVWDDARITERLRDLPDVLERYLGSVIVELLCGSRVKTVGVISGAGPLPVAGSVLAECSFEFVRTVETELPQIRELARSGRIREASGQVETFRKSPRWHLLDGKVKARILKFAAALHLDCSDDTEGARALAEETRSYNPDEDLQLIEGILLYRQEGIDAALTRLTEPHDVDAWNAKLSLMLEKGQVADVMGAVGAPAFPPNAGTHRIASIASILAGDLVKARSHSDEALRLAPKAFHVRLHAARMEYMRALLPQFPALRHIDWPVPPNWSYLRRDAGSLKSLEDAEATFRELIGLMEVQGRERQHIEAWRLGCLANHPARRGEAALYAQELLERDAKHVPCVVWAMERNLPFDEDRIRSALKDLDVDRLSPDGVQALCTLLVKTGDHRAAVDLLEDAHPLFESIGAGFPWRHLRAQLAITNGQCDEAIRISGEEPDPARRRNIEIAVLRVVARQSGEFGPLADKLVEFSVGEAASEYLFEACAASLEAGRPRFVAEHADALLKHFPTASALQMALHGAFEARRFKQYLDLLRTHRSLFQEGQLPAQVRRGKVECLRLIGALDEAVKAAEMLVHEGGSTEDLIQFFVSQLSAGDLRGSAITARRLVRQSDLTSAGLLYVAKAVFTEDSAVAREALEEAIRRGVGEGEIPAAVELAFRLGEERLIAALMPRFVELAKKAESPVKAVALPELKDVMRAGAELRQRTIRLFNEAAVPIHLVAGALGCPLVALFYDVARGGRERGDLLQGAPLLIRHGSRGPVSTVEFRPGTVFIDETSILLLADMELLDVVEEALAPLMISAHLPQALRHQIDESSPSQPSLEQERQAVLRIVDAGRIGGVMVEEPPADLLDRYGNKLGERWCSLLGRAHRQNGLFCDFVPPLGSSGIPVALATEDDVKCISCGDVVAGLCAMGAISNEEAAEAHRRLGQDGGRFNRHANLRPGITLVLDNGVAEQLAAAGILEALASYARLEMASESVAELRALGAAHNRRLERVVWLRNLLDRVQRGISTGTLRTVTLPESDGDPGSEPRTLDEQCLQDLLVAGKMGAAVAWADDRFVTRYERVGDVPSVGICEILRFLRQGGQLPEAAYFEAMLNLRRSNARYIPLSEDEVRFHLVRAPVVAEGLRETPALVTLRRYVASCCLDSERLQLPKKSDVKAKITEFPWVVETVKAVCACIAQLWANGSLTEEERHVRANWLLMNLLVPLQVAVETLTKEAPPNDGVDGPAATIVLLLAAGFRLESPWERDREATGHPRASFYRWVGARLIEPLRQIAPSVLAKVGEFAAPLVVHEPERGLSARDRDILRGVSVRTLIDLPGAIKDVMPLDSETCRWLGVKRGGWSVSCFGRKFGGDAFWRAVDRATRKGRAKLRTADGRDEFHFQSVDSRSPRRRLGVTGPGLPEHARFVEPSAMILAGPPTAKRAYLRRRIDWLDCGLERKERLIDRILTARDPAARLRRLYEAQSVSAELFYRRLYRRVRRGYEVPTDACVLPSPDALLDHLRLRDEGFSGNKVCFASCSKRLIAEVGLAGAIERFAVLPITLPTPILAAIRIAGEEEFVRLSARLKRRLKSPISRMHLAHVLACRAGVASVHLKEAGNIAGSLFDSGAVDKLWRAFDALLDWSLAFIEISEGWRHLDAATCLTLAWLHAGRLHNMLCLADADDDLVCEAFRNATESFGWSISGINSALRHDAAHPRFANMLVVLLRGWGAILATLPDDIASALRLSKKPWVDGDGQLVAAAAAFLRDASLGTNALGSFLGGDGMGILARAIGEDEIKSLLPISPPEVIRQSVAQFCKNCDDRTQWNLLCAAARDCPLPRDLADELGRVFSEIDLKKVVLGCDQDWERAIFLLLAAGRNGSDQLPARVAEGIENAVFALAAQYRDSTGAIDVLERRVGLIVRCLTTLAIVPNDERASYRRVYQYSTRLAIEWPAAVPILRRLTSGWPTRLPLSRQRGFWELELTLRALS